KCQAALRQRESCHSLPLDETRITSKLRRGTALYQIRVDTSFGWMNPGSTLLKHFVPCLLSLDGSRLLRVLVVAAKHPTCESCLLSTLGGPASEAGRQEMYRKYKLRFRLGENDLLLDEARKRVRNKLFREGRKECNSMR